MTRFFRVAWGFGLAGAAALAMAQDKPVFTATTVHPFDPPVLGAPRDAEAPPPVVSRPIARGKTPRAHAQEVAEVFRQACLQGRAQVAAASDWALNHGFSPMSEEGVKALSADAAASAPGTSPVNVFVRQVDAADSMMLMLGDQPLACSVVTRQAVDGPRLRDRMAQLVAGWSGQAKAPAPTLTLDTPGSSARTVGYKLTDGRSVDSLLVTSPVAVGKGLTLLALSIDDAPPAR